jgi:hypothetical protein
LVETNTICKQTLNENRAAAALSLTQEIHTLSESLDTLLIYATDGAASQSKGQHGRVVATTVVAYHQGTEVQHGDSERLVGTAQNKQGTSSQLKPWSLAQLILVDWQADGRPTPANLAVITNCASSVNRLTNLGTHPSSKQSPP